MKKKENLFVVIIKEDKRTKMMSWNMGFIYTGERQKMSISFSTQIASWMKLDLMFLFKVEKDKLEDQEKFSKKEIILPSSAVCDSYNNSNCENS